jgi:hypothetical protein
VIYASDGTLTMMEQHKVQGTGLEEDGTTKSSFASKMQQERIDKKIDALF